MVQKLAQVSIPSFSLKIGFKGLVDHPGRRQPSGGNEMKKYNPIYGDLQFVLKANWGFLTSSIHLCSVTFKTYLHFHAMSLMDFVSLIFLWGNS